MNLFYYVAVFLSLIGILWSLIFAFRIRKENLQIQKGLKKNSDRRTAELSPISKKTNEKNAIIILEIEEKYEMLQNAE